LGPVLKKQKESSQHHGFPPDTSIPPSGVQKKKLNNAHHLQCIHKKQNVIFPKTSRIFFRNFPAICLDLFGGIVLKPFRQQNAVVGSLRKKKTLSNIGVEWVVSRFLRKKIRTEQWRFDCHVLSYAREAQLFQQKH